MLCYKVEKKTEIIEYFKTAIGSTAKSLSNSEKVEVYFGNQNTKSNKESIKLPEIEKINNKINYSQIRALADSESLKLRYSNSKTFKSFEPEGSISKKLYEIAEKIRFEKLGSDKFKGVKFNLETYYQERIESLNLKSSEDKIIESFENYLRVKFLEFKNNKNLDKKLKSFKKDLDEKFKNRIKELNNFTNDQAQFNSLVAEIISTMSLDENFEDEDKKDDGKEEEKQNDPKNPDQKADKQKQEKQEMSIESGIPDVDNQAKETDQDLDEIEVEDKTKSDYKRKIRKSLGDIKKQNDEKA